MGYRRGLGLACWVVACLGLLLPGLSGCAMLNSFLDPTTIGQFPSKYKERGIRRMLTPRDTPPGPPNAGEPTPEDLVPIYADYRVGPGDGLIVDVQDAIAVGVPERLGLEVSSTGNLRIPHLGSVKVTGLTEQELEEELKARYREAEILPDPDVRVYVQAKRGRVFTVRGWVGRTGQYPIYDPDTRMLDVIGMIGDIGASATEIYVIRRSREAPGAMHIEEVAEPNGLIIQPPEEEEFEQANFLTAGGLAAQEPPPTERSAREQEKAELEELLVPRTATRPTPPGAARETQPPLPPLIFDPQTGDLIKREIEPPPLLEQQAPSVEEILDEPFEWEDVPEAVLEQRVIRINVRALLDGDPNYNIVIRDKDVINVPVDTGIFYMMGEINRPGVYGFNGRDITITQAIATTGGFSPLAWPQRCEIIRHEPGTDKQVTIPVNLDLIFAGLEEDLYLRDDDIVNVGTHFVAPFLFVIRNSFRFTYGFGFVYDRNFADQDAYGAKMNPQYREDIRKQQQGLPY